MAKRRPLAAMNPDALDQPAEAVVMEIPVPKDEPPQLPKDPPVELPKDPLPIPMELMVRLPFLVSAATTETGFIRRRLDFSLTPKQRITFERLFRTLHDGSIRSADGKHVDKRCHVLGCLLDRIAAAEDELAAKTANCAP